MTKTIEIIVMPNGQATVATKGFQGASCREASRFVEQAIGKSAGERLTPEFYQTESVQQSQRQRP
jgi:hypothetical protein